MRNKQNKQTTQTNKQTSTNFRNNQARFGAIVGVDFRLRVACAQRPASAAAVDDDDDDD
jgi:hypothetical protein